MAESLCASSTADRELLSFMLAMRLGMISRAQFAVAVGVWSADRSKSGEGTENHNLLTPTIRSELDPLVAAHIARHGGDIRWSLADLGAIPEIDQVLTQQGDRGAPTAIFQTRNGAPSAGTPAPCPGAVSRFQILRPHARGGLGEVCVARDEELNREVALKEIQSQYAFQTEHWPRFLLEAEITGSLEHPGIVPVYGLGAYPDGRPYYAMRLIQGDSLQEAIRRFHEKDGTGRDQQERSLALRELLGRFVDVCQAVAYAHSRGVLYRDRSRNASCSANMARHWSLMGSGQDSPPLPAKSSQPPARQRPRRHRPSWRRPWPRLCRLTHRRQLRSHCLGGRAAGPSTEQPVTPRTPHSRDMATQMGQAMGTLRT